MFEKLIGLILAILAGAGAVYFKGRGDRKRKQEAKDAKAYQDTRQRMDREPVITDADTARKWLRARDPGQR